MHPPQLQERLLVLMEGHVDGMGDVQHGESERVLPHRRCGVHPFCEFLLTSR